MVFMLKPIIVKLIMVVLLLLSWNIAANAGDKSKTNDENIDTWSSHLSLQQGFYLQIIASSNQKKIKK